MTREYIPVFDELISQMDDYYVLPIEDGQPKETILELGSLQRSKQYARLGAHMAQQSHILVALWNGISDGMKMGGTAYVVASKLGENDDFYDEKESFEWLDAGLVYHIVTPKTSTPHVIGERYQGHFLYPLHGGEEHNEKQKNMRRYTSILQNIDDFKS